MASEDIKLMDSRIRRRRRLGVVCLLAAIGMIMADEFKLAGPSKPTMLYWLICFLFTLLAVWTALAELRALRRTSRSEQRNLFENTLQEISHESEARHPNDVKKGPGDAGGHP